MTLSEEQFIKTVGEERFQRALGAAFMFVRADRRFVGLDKVRDPIIWAAAGQALGGGFACRLLNDHSRQKIGDQAADELAAFLEQATAHVRQVMGGSS